MRNFLAGFIIAFLLLAAITEARTFLVGPTQRYKHPSFVMPNLKDNDTILVDSAEYAITGNLRISKNHVLIRGVGGRPKFMATASFFFGLLTIDSSYAIVDNLELCGADSPDSIGCGIRSGGFNLTVRNCYIHDNQDGILEGHGNVLIENCEFANNGRGDGYTHNMYIVYPDTFTLRNCYTHGARVGHCVKSRAAVNYILNNRIMDEDTGNASYQIDIPDGGTAYIVGNLIQQGPNFINENLLSYGLESLSKPAPHRLMVVNNTFVNDADVSAGFILINHNLDSLILLNNLFIGQGIVETALDPDSLFRTGNLVFETSAAAGLRDAAHYDYRLTASSPAINAGVAISGPDSAAMYPGFEYRHPASGRVRPVTGALDAGAYEYDSTIAVETFARTVINQPRLDAMPTPFSAQTDIAFSLSAKSLVILRIYDVSGRKVATLAEGVFEAGRHHCAFKAGRLAAGIYLCQLQASGRTLERKIVLTR